MLLKVCVGEEVSCDVYSTGGIESERSGRENGRFGGAKPFVDFRTRFPTGGNPWRFPNGP